MSESWVHVAHLLDIPEGTFFPVEVGGRSLLVCHIEGAIYCIENQCSHRVYPLEQGKLSGFQIECPLHGGTFDVRDGAATGFPACTPIQTFATRLDEDFEVYIQP